MGRRPSGRGTPPGVNATVPVACQVQIIASISKPIEVAIRMPT